MYIFGGYTPNTTDWQSGKVLDTFYKIHFKPGDNIGKSPLLYNTKLPCSIAIQIAI